MLSRHVLTAVFLVGTAILTGRVAPAGEESAAVVPSVEVISQSARTAIRRGLDFLQRDVVKWRNEHECSTCHHGALTTWVYLEAQDHGYPIDRETLKDSIAWASQRTMDRIDLPRDTRPGWKMVNTPAIYFALAARSVSHQDAFSADDLKRIAGHLMRHQEDDGSWAWSSAPPGNRPPPFFESDEVATRLAFLALEAQVPDDPNTASPARDSRQRAAAWLKSIEPADTAQAEVLRLMMQVREGDSPDAVQQGIDKLLARQNGDGGWGQLRDLPSDGYATGQALYALNLAGLNLDRAEVRRGIGFLTGTQRDDGSWPMKSRSHPGAEPFKNPVPITCFGSAWATLGLIRSVADRDTSNPVSR